MRQETRLGGSENFGRRGNGLAARGAQQQAQTQKGWEDTRERRDESGLVDIHERILAERRAWRQAMLPIVQAYPPTTHPRPEAFHTSGSTLTAPSSLPSNTWPS